MAFSLLSSLSDHALLHSEMQTVTTDQEGLINAVIGTVQAGLEDALAGGDPSWRCWPARFRFRTLVSSR